MDTEWVELKSTKSFDLGFTTSLSINTESWAKLIFIRDAQ